MTAPPTNVLPPETAARLTAFARALKAAARAVALYPPEHPAIGEALLRLTKAAAAATERGPFSVLVVPDNLLVEGRVTARPDQAIADLATLLHSHMVGELVVQRDADPASWRMLLGLLARDPDDVRAHGGIARALTTAGGLGLEIHELDYSGMIRERNSGTAASWDAIIANCLQTSAVDLDEKTLRLLSEIAADPARLAEFFARASEATGSQSPRDCVTALLRAMRGVTGFVAGHQPDELEHIFGNMAAATAYLSPEVMLELLGAGRDPEQEHKDLVAEIVLRITDPTLARFIARTVAAERSCTQRLAEAFRTLVPDHDRQRSVVSLAREEVARTPVGEEPGFDGLWTQVEELLTSYSDKPYVSETYNLELAQASATLHKPDHLTDDPPERIVGWLTTVSDAAIRALDIRMLADLLVVETDTARREELLDLVITQIDDLVGLGDFEGARQLVDGVRGTGATAVPADTQAQSDRAVGTLVAGPLMSNLALQLNGVHDEEFPPIKAFCASIGPSLVPRLAETLAGETRPRARQRMTDLLIAFGEHGRHSVDQLLQSPSATVRRTAVQLLRTFGGSEAVSRLETLLNDTEPSVQRETARALISMGTEDAFALLERCLASEHDRGRPALIDELSTTRDPHATPLFCSIVERAERRGALREFYPRAIERLGLLGGPDAVAALTGVLHRARWWAPLQTRDARQRAAEALSRIALPAAAEALREAATSGSLGVRAVARKYVKEEA